MGEIRNIVLQTFDCPEPDCVRLPFRTLNGVLQHLRKQHPAYLDSDKISDKQYEFLRDRSASDNLLAEYHRHFPVAASKHQQRLRLHMPDATQREMAAAMNVAVIIDDCNDDGSLSIVAAPPSDESQAGGEPPASSPRHRRQRRPTSATWLKDFQCDSDSVEPPDKRKAMEQKP